MWQVLILSSILPLIFLPSFYIDLDPSPLCVCFLLHSWAPHMTPGFVTSVCLFYLADSPFSSFQPLLAIPGPGQGRGIFLASGPSARSLPNSLPIFQFKCPRVGGSHSLAGPCLPRGQSGDGLCAESEPSPSPASQDWKDLV